MILLANFLLAIAKILHILLIIYLWVIIFRAVLSWIQAPSLYQIKVILYYLTAVSYTHLTLPTKRIV